MADRPKLSISPGPSDDYWQNAYAYTLMVAKYEDLKAIAKEARDKRKALDDIKADNPFYHRATASAEMAQIREDMALIVAENKRMHDMIDTIGDLHQRLSVVYGAYDHVKMLAERSRIDYAAISQGLQDITKLKQELQNEINERSPRPDGTEG